VTSAGQMEWLCKECECDSRRSNEVIVQEKLLCRGVNCDSRWSNGVAV
jgi:hypothetical protein